ncbi:hypothetical protein LXL04_016839 [Taraxacum kok-saghyz]
MNYNDSQEYCSANFDLLPYPGETGVVSVNFTLKQVESIQHYCDILSHRELEDMYSKPMVWIGIYIAVASLFCVLAMAADLWNGFRYGKFWFPSKYFSLNAVSITVIAIAMKLPLDLNTPMDGKIEQVAKMGSLVFMCTMIANLMPSLTSIDNKDLPTNVIGLAILIITIIVNTIMEIFTGVIYGWVITFSLVAMLLFLLIVLISVAIFVPISKQILEFKYQDIKKRSLSDQHVVIDRSIIERLRQHVTRYGIMVETGSPQFVMAGNVLSSASGIICGIGLAFSIWMMLTLFYYTEYLFEYVSQYNWSIPAICTIQFVGVLVGSIAPIVRCTTVTSKKSLATWTRKHFVIFKVEKYWTQKLYEWKESHITVLSLGRRSRSVFRKLKRIILSIWIGIQIATVVACKVICLIPILCLIMVSCCSNYLKCFSKGRTSDTLTSIEDTNEDLSRYVLLLEDDMELAEKKLKRISQYVNRVIKTGEKEQDNNLLKLLKKSTGFEGVSEFDMFQVVPPLSFELPNSWSLPIATLTSIAIALPNIGSDVTDNLFKSVAEGLFYTNLVDESLNKACQCVNVRKAAITLWDEVEDKCKWLGNTLEKNAYEGKTAKEILEWFVQKAEEILEELYHSCHGEPIEKLPQNLIVANSMKRIAQTIMCTYNISEITKKQLFVLLSRMISDIFVACFTNIPRVITMMCHESAIEKREDSLEAAALTLGRTTEILKEIATRELPGMDPDKFALIDEWRLHLQSIPC